MATQTLAQALQLIGVTEGGFSNNPADPGGQTYRGVTLATLSAERGHPCTAQELQQLGVAEWSDIMTRQYATPIRYDDLPAGLDYALLDFSVNSGPGRAMRTLQQDVLSFAGRDVDGIIGSKTLAAIAARDAPLLIGRLGAARLAYCRSLKAWGAFGKGWTNRIDQVDIQAAAMAAGGQPVPSVASGAGKATGATKLLSMQAGKTAIAAAAGGVVAAGTAASQASGLLQAFSSYQLVAYLLLGLGVIGAAVPLAEAVRKAASGEAAA